MSRASVSRASGAAASEEIGEEGGAAAERGEATAASSVPTALEHIREDRAAEEPGGVSVECKYCQIKFKAQEALDRHLEVFCEKRREARGAKGRAADLFGGVGM